MKVTVDTGLLPVDDLEPCFEGRGWTTLIVSVSEREVEETRLASKTAGLERVREVGVWDESRWDNADWGDEPDATQLERILHVVSNGSFPTDRRSLTKGERAQLRDAMILQAHLRSGADLFVTTDLRAFIRGGRREALEREFATRILTRREVEGWCL